MLIAPIKDNLNRIVVASALFSGVYILYFTVIHFGWLFGVLFGFIPIGLVITLWLFHQPKWMYIIIYTINYFIAGGTRYINIPVGITMDILLIIMFLILFVESGKKNVDWIKGFNGLSSLAIIWLLYCFLELFNPQVTSAEAWMTSIRGVAGYFFIIAFLTPIFFRKYKDLKLILYLWSAFTLIVVLKAIWQRYIGFDNVEKYWLYVYGAASTHILNTGIRYFSLFSDAANFGASMGFSMVVFSIASLHMKNKWIRIYFIFVSVAAGYGLLLSGTRAALAVPFAGIALFIILSKNSKIIPIALILLISAFVFLKYTNAGQGNPLIRRMRSAFNTEDASFQLRMSNQEKMKTYMIDKPFGVGLGLGGGKAKRYAPEAYMSQIPTDSWFVMIWVETGVVGLILHLFILIYIVVYGLYLSMFKLKDKELRGIHNGLISGIFGMMVASYANEVFAQFPNGFLIYTSQAFIFLALIYDKELEEKQLNENNKYELNP